MLEWLEKWYKSQCNNEWEHNFGIKIETIDNPGWTLSIDLEDTEHNLNMVNWSQFGDFDKRWVGFKIEKNVYYASSDPENLNTLIYIFKEFIEKGDIDENEINNKLK